MGKIKFATLAEKIMWELSQMEFRDTEFTTAPKSNFNYSDFPRITKGKLDILAENGVDVGYGEYKHLWQIDFDGLVQAFYEKERQLFLYTIEKHGFLRQMGACREMYAHPLAFEMPKFTEEDRADLRKYRGHVRNQLLKKMKPKKQKRKAK
jgi:hypothetical protein